MKLTIEQTEFIKRTLIESGITSASLYDDVFDHVCSFVEEHSSTPEDFDVGLAAALNDVAPMGLKFLQRETTMLHNFQNPQLMKKVTFAIGAICAMAFITGSSFILLGWLGGLHLMLAGFIGFVFLFLPILTIQSYRTDIQHSVLEKIKYSTGIVSGVCFCLAFVFKTAHMPRADELLVFGTLVCVAGFLPTFFLSLYRKTFAS